MIKTIPAKIIPAKKIKVCDICNGEQQDEDDKKKRKACKVCPICKRDFCEYCSCDFWIDAFGTKGQVCEKCGDILNNNFTKAHKTLFNRQFFKPIMDFCRKIVIVEKL
jgi:hypothetical protein